MGATPHYLAPSIYLFSRSGHYHHLDKAPLPTSYYARPQIRETGARSHLENGRSSSSRSTYVVEIEIEVEVGMVVVPAAYCLGHT